MYISKLFYFLIIIITTFSLKIIDLTITDSLTQCSNRGVNEPGEANDAIMNVPHNTPVPNVVTPNAVINDGANIPLLVLNPEEIPAPLEANVPVLNSNPFETPPTYPSVPPVGANPPPLNLEGASNLAQRAGIEPPSLPSTNSDSDLTNSDSIDCGD
jgi:hypothetical protein